MVNVRQAGGVRVRDLGFGLYVSWVRVWGGEGGGGGGVQSDKRNTAHNQHVPTLSLLEILVMAKKVECNDDIFDNRQATSVCFDSNIFMKTIQ
jgi:hypothetical protein